MTPESSGLRERPFADKAPPLVYISYSAQQDALRGLAALETEPRGLVLLHGSEGAGKSLLVRHYLDQLGSGVSIVSVDGEGLYASQLLARILAQLGFEMASNSSEELLGAIGACLLQRPRGKDTPLLVIDNLHRMLPGALSALCKLAALRVREAPALRMLLLSGNDSRRILRAPNMTAIAERLAKTIELRPMQVRESISYLYGKLRAAGSAQPDDIFPVDTCEHLHELASGLPGKLETLAASLLDGAERLPVRVEDVSDAPRFIISRDGEVLQDVEAVETRLLIGRSELSDIFLADQFISKQHALLIWNDDLLLLIDLNSSNGTLVNSRRIRTQVLRHNDVVSVGDHRIKVVFERAGVRSDFDDDELADTAKMKNIADARRSRALRQRPLRLVR